MLKNKPIKIPYDETECVAIESISIDEEGKFYATCMRDGKTRKICDGSCLGVCKLQQPILTLREKDEIKHYPEVDDIMIKVGLIPFNDIDSNDMSPIDRTELKEQVEQGINAERNRNGEKR